MCVYGGEGGGEGRGGEGREGGDLGQVCKDGDFIKR